MQLIYVLRKEKFVGEEVVDLFDYFFDVPTDAQMTERKGNFLNNDWLIAEISILVTTKKSRRIY